jgi:hypothetical protein
MAEKTNKLAELLRQATETKKLVKENAKAILESTTKEVISEELQKESLFNEDADEDNDFTEVSADEDGDTIDEPMETEPEMGDVEDGEEITPIDPDMDMGMDAESEIDMDAEPEMGDDMPVQDDTVMDLTNASREEVMDAIANAPDDAEIVIVKSPAYDVSVNDGGQNDIPTPAPKPEMGEVEDDTFDEMVTETESVIENDDNGLVAEDYNEVQMNESLLLDKNNKLKLYEGRIVKFKRAVLKLMSENKKLVAKQVQYDTALTETSTLLENLKLTNVNLVHITRLITENTVKNDEKIEILKEFDNKVTTVNESKILFESWTKLLNVTSANQNKTIANLSNLNETVIVRPKNILKESKSLDSGMGGSQFDRIANYDIG